MAALRARLREETQNLIARERAAAQAAATKHAARMGKLRSRINKLENAVTTDQEKTHYRHATLATLAGKDGGVVSFAKLPSVVSVVDRVGRVETAIDGLKVQLNKVLSIVASHAMSQLASKADVKAKNAARAQTDTEIAESAAGAAANGAF